MKTFDLAFGAKKGAVRIDGYATYRCKTADLAQARLQADLPGYTINIMWITES
jgi:hypothetical protein